MTSKRVNVLVYSGNGSTVGSVRHCLYSLRRLLSPNYAVTTVSSEAIFKEPWSASCALLVFPGGADLGYCRSLNGEGNRRIAQYVNRGGKYLGFCAGGYYGCKKCEFENGNKDLEVVGDRELGFFPGICRGLAFAGFVYHSEAGARAANLKVHKSAFSKAAEESLPDSFHVYYNGGGVFVDAESMRDKDVEILASYTERLHVDGGHGAAAVVYRKLGDGSVILTGPHPEFAAANLYHREDRPDDGEVIEKLTSDDDHRVEFLRACLRKLGLEVNREEQAIPSLSLLHLSSYKPSDTAELLCSIQDIISVEDGEEYIKGENDTFRLEKYSTSSLSSLTDAVKSAVPVVSSGDNTEEEADTDDRPLNYDKVLKRIKAHEKHMPDAKETPYFNHHAFFASLQRYTSSTTDSDGAFGRYLLYGEVITSTNTILEKNVSLLQHLPSGFTATATTQVAGRGRGTNIWISAPGSLLFSTVVKHPISLTQSAPVVFVQYLAAMATVQGIHTYDLGYTSIPVKLKWPNDVYALDPVAATQKSVTMAESMKYIKIAGILVNSSYSGGDYNLVVGIGLNVANTAPTTSLDALAKAKGLPPFQSEKLLARILNCLERLYKRFCREGWSRSIEHEYYANWLHSEQIVTLEAEGGSRARVKGITSDWGLLLAEELGWEDRPTGKIWQLQSDSNSFDFFKGLLKRKG